MNEHNSLPNMRFKGFTDKWKQEKLGNIATVEMNKRIYKNQTNEKGEIPFYKIGTFGKKADSFISNKLFNEYKKKYPYPKVGDILISASGTIGNTIVYKGEDAYFQDSNIVWLNINHNIILNSFLYSFYQIVHWRGIEGSTIKRLYNSNILSTPINYPSVNEQQKIGNFFAKLDKLLDLQQQKIDKLELLKKALLQKLFPKHDTKIPELRFKGYDGEWEKEKLSKFGHTFSGLSGKTKKDFGHGKAKYITYMNVFKNPLTSKTELDDIEVDSKQHTVKYGDVLFTMSSETPDEVGMSSVWKYHLENIYLNSFSFGYRHSTKFDLNFLAFMFRSQVVREQIKILAQGISRYNISKNKMIDILAYFPTESEQQKIGNLLSKVDQLIELENKKLQNFQQVKKCLLQNMFVD